MSSITKPIAAQRPSPPPALYGPLDWFVIAALLVGWGLLELVINPTGDFPLNDDWCYGLSVKWLVQEGRLSFTQQLVALVTQVIWGALFTIVTGFSFTVLRVSTIVIAGVGLAATYLTGREVGLSRMAALCLAGLFAVNPVFIDLSNTFMTDVPFLSLVMLSTLLLLRGMKDGRPVSLSAGWLIALAASLIRQLGVGLPVGMVIAAVIKDGVNRRTLVRIVIPAAIVVLTVVVVYPRFLMAIAILPNNYFESTNSVKAVLGSLVQLKLGALKPPLFRVGYGLMHLGLWMLPWLILTQPSWIPRASRSSRLGMILALGGAAGVVTALLWTFGQLMPLGSVGNILLDFGVGPRDLPGGAHSHAPRWFWALVTFASAYGAASLIVVLGRVIGRATAAIRSGHWRQSLWLASFLLVSAAVCYGPFCFSYRRGSIVISYQ